MMSQAFHGNNDWGPVGGRLVCGTTINSTTRIMYADQFGFYATSSLTFTTSTTPVNRQSYQMAWSPNLNRLCAANVTTGTSSIIYSNNAGLTWQFANLPNNSQCHSVKWIQELGVFYAGINNGSSASIVRSTDGINWSHTNLKPTTSSGDFIWDIEFSPTLNILTAVINRGGTASHVWSSDRGLTWEQGVVDITLSPGGPRTLKWIGKYGKFFSIGDTNTPSGNNWFCTSTDGKNWTKNIFDNYTNVGGGVINFTIDFLPNYNRIVVGKFTGANTNRPFVISDNGGANWYEVVESSSAKWNYDSWYNPDSELLYIVQSSGNIVRVSRDGINWWNISMPSSSTSVCWIPNPNPIGRIP